MRSELKTWARTHFFRAWTAAAAIVLLGVAFVYRPDILAWYLRTTMNFIELGSRRLPYPWGDQIEVVLKAVGGHIWFQLALAIILVRAIVWLPVVGWRHRPTKQTPTKASGLSANKRT